ncbi:MAG: hypothetical protein E2604_07140 [Flavobacterium sp.]|nr:hypothetical protein [Flavobacterium sp.]
MQKITIKELVNFRRRSDKNKKNFAYKLKHREAKEKTNVEGGGHYWITSNSCIANVYKTDNKELYDSKIDNLHSRFNNTEIKQSKSMYQQNIDILSSFKDFDFNELKPNSKLKFESVPTNSKVLTVYDFPLFVNPNLVFSYDINGKNELGALWLVPQINGFKKAELGMFCEILYRFLIKNYSDNFQISQEYCIVIDTLNAQKVTYTDLIKDNIPFLIDQTLNEIKEL